MSKVTRLGAPAAAGRTLIALHCSGAGGRAFDGYRELIDRDTRFVTPDLIGYGAAEPAWPAFAPASLDAEADRLAPLLRGDEGGVHLLGHSYGGAVALQLALRWPQQVRSLTLYEPVRFALLRADPGLWAAITGVGRRIGELAMQGRLAESAELFVDYWARPGAWAALAPSRQAAVASRMSKVRAEFEAAFDDALAPSAYRALSMPVTVIAGGRSPAPARRIAERLVEACPDARLVRAPQCGHMGALERPDVVLSELPWAGVAIFEAA